MKINQRALETSLKMTSKAGIIAFTTLGVVCFLLTFLGIAFTTPKTMATWKILLGAIGGSILVGIFTVVVLGLSRYLLIKKVRDNTDATA